MRNYDSQTGLFHKIFGVLGWCTFNRTFPHFLRSLNTYSLYLENTLNELTKKK